MPPLPPLLRVLGVLSDRSSDGSSRGLDGRGLRMAAVKDRGGVATNFGIVGGLGFAWIGVALVGILAHLLAGIEVFLVLVDTPLTLVGA